MDPLLLTLEKAISRGWTLTCYTLPEPGQPWLLHPIPPEYHRARNWAATYRSVDVNPHVTLIIPHWFEEEVRHRRY